MKNGGNQLLKDSDYMEMALSSAAREGALAPPGPMAGCLLASWDRVLALATRTDRGHEVQVALEHAGHHARGATAFVTATPSVDATKALINAGVVRVVIAPDGSQIVPIQAELNALLNAGITVQTGVLSQRERSLNRANYKLAETGLPYLTLIVGLDSVHAQGTAWERMMLMRHAHDAILTDNASAGRTKDAFQDMTGLPRHRPLMRILLDPKLEVAATNQLVDSWKNDLIILTASTDADRIDAIRGVGIAVENLGEPDATLMLSLIASWRNASLIVQADLETNRKLLAAGLVDEVTFFHVAGECICPDLREWLDGKPHITHDLPLSTPQLVTLYRLE